MFETLEKPMRSASGRKCPIDGVSPVAVQTPLPTTPSTFRPRKGPRTHNPGDNALPLDMLKSLERASPSKSPAAETPRELKEVTAPIVAAANASAQPQNAAPLDQFDRQLPFQRPAGSAAIASVARPSQQDSPSSRLDSITKIIEANRSSINDGIKKLLEDYAKKFPTSSPSPTSVVAAQSAEDPLTRIVKHFSGPQGVSPFPAPAAGHGATPSGPVDKEVSGLLQVAPMTKRQYQDPAMQAIPKPKADTSAPITIELLKAVAAESRTSTKKLLRSDKSNFSETATTMSTSSKTVEPKSATSRSQIPT